MIVSEWLRRFWYLTNRRRLERELQDEMEAHREALNKSRPFGNTLRLREQSRDVWGWNWLDEVWRDLAYGVQSLLRSPGFTLAAVLVLALGMGVNLAEFQIFDAVIHRLQVRDMSTLARFSRDFAGRSSGFFDPQAVAFYRQYNSSFSSISEEASVAAVPSLPGITLDGDPTPVRASFVSNDYFQTLGVVPAYGRLLDEQDSMADAEPTAVLGHRYWERSFGSDPAVIGQIIRLNGKPVRVVGITSYNFSGVEAANTFVWLPNTLETYMGGAAEKARSILIGAPSMFGRLKPGITLGAAENEFRSLATELQKENPKLFQPRERIRVERIDALDIDLRTTAVGSILVLLVLTVLFAACANLGNMLLARGLARHREIDIRLAIGADTWRVVRQLMTENLLLGSIGAIAALALGRLVSQILVYMIDEGGDIRVVTDWRLLIAASILTLFAVSAFGLVPAFRSVRRGPHTARAGKVLVAVQVAVSCAFLILSSLLVHGMFRNLASDASIDYKHMIVADPALYLQSLNAPSAREGLDEQMDRVRSLQGVDGVTIASIPPFGNRRWMDKPAGSAQSLYLNAVDSSYFDFMQLRFRAGRPFVPSEQDPIVVSQSAARALWPGEDALGKTLDLQSHSHTVVGVVADSGVNSVAAPASVEAYVPLDDPSLGQAVLRAVLLIHANVDPNSLLNVIRAAATMNDRPPLVSSMNNDLARQAQGSQRLLIMIGALSGVATVIAASGIFGLIVFTVSQKTKEIGVRIALGANAADIVRSVVGQYVVSVGAGLMAGVAIAIAGSQILQGARPDIPRFELVSYTAALLGFLIIAACAALLPCLKALRMEPASVLRHD